jgi:hypothetical protein
LLAACAALVGVGDVPPLPDGSASPTDDGSVDSAAEAAVLDRAEPAIGADGGTPVGPADATPDGALDDGAADTLPDVVILAECASVWETYDPRCNLCGQQNCCDALAACEVVDDAGLEPEGGSFCNEYVHCVTGYRRTPGADAEALCMGTYSSSELALGNTALACIRSSCQTPCDQL